MDEELLKKLGLSIARGVPQMATGFVDLAGLPFTMTGLLEPEEVVGSTAYLTNKGLLPPPQEGVIPETLEMVSGALSPQGAATGGLLALGTMASAKGAKNINKAINKAIKTAQDEAMEIAQRNAALPIEEGGLGLPKDNTAMDRARALGFDIELFHGTDQDLKEFLINKQIEKDFGWYGDNATYLTPDPDAASGYASYHEKGIGENVMPLLVRRGKVFDYGDAQPLKNRDEAADFTRMMRKLGYDTVEVPNKYAADEYSKNYETVVLDPKNIRSRFAAFDPFKRDSANILAGLGATGIGLGLLTPKEDEKY